MIRLLTAHKILVGAFVALALILVLWGVQHRGQPHAWVALVMGGLGAPAGALYLRKLFRSPPLK